MDQSGIGNSYLRLPSGSDVAAGNRKDVASKVKAAGAAAFLISISILPAAADGPTAQTAPTAQEGIADRLPYRAPGIGLGPFDLYASVTGRALYDSNVFARSSIHDTDKIIQISPNLVLQSNWTRNDLRLEANSISRVYSKFDRETHTDYYIKADGRLDVWQPLRILLDGSYQIQHEDRSSPDQPQDAATPTRYDSFPLSARMDYLFSNFGIRGGIKYSHITWNDTIRTDAEPLDNHDRDLTELTDNLAFRYQVSPGYYVFISGTHFSRDYKQKRDRYGLQRSSKGNSLDIGVDFELTRLLTGEAFVGYQKFSPDDSVLPGANGIDYGATLTWYPTPVMTVTFNASRSFDASTLNGVGGVSVNSFWLGVGYNLLRNFAISGDLEYTKSVFEGRGNREDFGFAGDLEGAYYVNQFAQVGLRYGYHDRSSDLSENNYAEHRAGIFIKLQR